MIKKLVLENFQIHKKSELELSPGVNVIAGQSDNGKTAIVRGLGWVFNNRPQGFGFKRDGSGPKDTTTVQVCVDNHVLARKKSDKVNCYVLDEVEFKALRTDVPDNIQNVLNLSEANFQSQHSPYFLILDSPGEIAKKLNRLIGLDVIDDTISKINKKASNFLAQANAHATQVETLQKAIAAFPDLNKLHRMATRCASMEATLKIDATKVETIRNNLHRIAIDKKALARVTPMAGLVPNITRCETMYTGYAKLNIDRTTLIGLVRTITTNNARLRKAENVCEAAMYFDLVESKYTGLAETQTNVSRIRSLISTIKHNEKNVVMIDTSIAKEQAALDKIIAENPVCSKCGQRIQK